MTGFRRHDSARRRRRKLLWAMPSAEILNHRREEERRIQVILVLNDEYRRREPKYLRAGVSGLSIAFCKASKLFRSLKSNLFIAAFEPLHYVLTLF